MNVCILNWEKILYKGRVDAITLPGSSGAFQVLKDHAPIISSLSKGMIQIQKKKPEGDEMKNFKRYKDHVWEYELNAGVVRIKDNQIEILISDVV